MGFGEGIATGAVGVFAIVGLLLVGGMAAEATAAKQLKRCMEISSPEQCLNQFIDDNDFSDRPDN